MRSILFPCVLLALPLWAWAQPQNDNCNSPIEITDVQEWCSEIGAFTNEGASPDGLGPGSCMSNVSHDVWFTFTAIAPDVTITVVGASGVGAGGTLSAPEIALYEGNCSAVSELECATAQGGVAELYKGALTVGQTYLIRVDGAGTADGTFELCISNYNPPVTPGSDCFTGSLLCDKSPFVVQSVVGPGSDPDEMAGTCLGGLGGNSESNSSWFAWTCDQAGSLTFTLTPTNPSDDLDFVVYELPNGPEDCSDKIPLKCMASGQFNTPNPPCMGPTGLNENATDDVEFSGCQAGDDNFLSALQMEAGKSYAVGINNFTSTGNGYSISFGGTGTFRGPEADFTTNAPNDTICMGGSITFTDNSSVPEFDNIVGHAWNFGVDASPATASGPGPHSVTYNSVGTKSITLTVENEQGGCITTTIGSVVISPCCETVNQMEITGTASELACANDASGTIDISVQSPFPITGFNWDNGMETEDIDGLVAGTYGVTVTNAFCEAEDSFTVNAPPPLAFDTLMTLATCEGGMDGGLTLNVSGGTPPYRFQWFDSPAFVEGDNSRTGLPIGQYDVTVRDANDCEEALTLEVRELELETDPQIVSATPPSCFGFSDGSIVLNIVNGQPPYVFDWNDGNGFVNENSLTGLADGTYMVTARDANGCLGNFTFSLQQPDSLTVALDSFDVSCFGQTDGSIATTVSGGTAPYGFLWSDGQTDSTATGLAAGDYSLTLTDANGCLAFGNTTVLQPPALFLNNIITEDVLCFGDSTGQATLQATGGNPPYTYSYNGFVGQADSLITNIAAGNHLGYVEDALGCQDSLAFSILQPLELVADAGPDLNIDLGFEAQIQGGSYPLGQPVSVSWSPDYNLSCSDCLTPTAFPYLTTTYYLNIVDSTGCTATDSVTVSVEDLRPVYIPNAFTPNADGANDVFTAFAGPAAQRIASMKIFDRWGGIVYSAENLPIGDDGASTGWDGTGEGKPLNPGVYVYLIEIVYVDGATELFSGDITILR